MTTCPCKAELERWLTDALPTAESAELEAHLEGCTVCRAFLDEHTAVPDALQEALTDDDRASAEEFAPVLEQLLRQPPTESADGETAAFAPLDCIITAVAFNFVIAIGTINQIIAAATGYGVVPIATIECIIPAVAVDLIATVAPINEVIVITAGDCVVIITTEERIRSVSALKPIRTIETA